jgi:hypothetical protein
MAADPAPREELHRLVDELPEKSLEPIVQLLRRARDPLLAILDAAPFDDEPLTPEDEAAIEEAHEQARAGQLRPLEEVLAELDAEDSA